MPKRTRPLPVQSSYHYLGRDEARGLVNEIIVIERECGLRMENALACLYPGLTLTTRSLKLIYRLFLKYTPGLEESVQYSLRLDIGIFSKAYSPSSFELYGSKRPKTKQSPFSQLQIKLTKPETAPGAKRQEMKIIIGLWELKDGRAIRALLIRDTLKEAEAMTFIRNLDPTATLEGCPGPLAISIGLS